MRKQFKNHKEESQIVWRNTTHDPQFNPWKRWFGVIKVGDKSFITDTYESKFRCEAVAIFEEEARLSKGKLEHVGVFN
jgi:hypothetical protein